MEVHPMYLSVMTVMACQLRSAAFADEVKAATAETLKGKVVLPKGSLKETKEVWIRIVKMDGKSDK